MGQTVFIQLFATGQDTGPFDIYTCTGGTCDGTAFQTNIPKSNLTSGQYFYNVPNGTDAMKVQSTGNCVTLIQIVISGSPIPTSTAVPTQTPTPTPTPTPLPCYCYTVNAPYQTQINWKDCSGNNQSQKVTASQFYLCAQQGTVVRTDQDPLSASTISGGTVVCTINTDCEPISGCSCYTFVTTTPGQVYNINYYDCDGNYTIQSVNSTVNPTYSVCGYYPIVDEFVDVTRVDSGSCIFNGVDYSCPEVFILDAQDLLSARLNVIKSTTPYTVDWGDGTVSAFTAGVNAMSSPGHIYNSPFTPFTGQIKIISYDLSGIYYFDGYQNFSGGTNKRMTIYGSEMSKLDGLTYFNNAYFVGYSGGTADLPNSLLKFYSYVGKITGNTSDLPSTMTDFQATEQNTVSGNTLYLPSTLKHLYVFGSNTITGDVADLPAGMKNFSLGGSNTVYGETQYLPSGLTDLYVWGQNTLSGDTFGLPRNLDTINLNGYNSLSGDTSGLPTGLTYCQLINTGLLPIGGKVTVSGDTSGLPRNLNVFTCTGLNTISGLTSALPSGLTYLYVVGSNKIGGSTSGFPSTLDTIYMTGSGTTAPDVIYGDVIGLPSATSISIYGYNIISGNTSNIPSTLTTFRIQGNNTISGDVKNVPTGINSLLIGNLNTANVYSGGRIWTSPMNDVSLYPVTAFSSTDVDNLLIDLSSSSWFGNREINIKGTRTAASNAAYNILTGSPNNVTITFY